MKKMKKYNDIELWDLAQKDKSLVKEIFQEIYDRYSSQVYKYCRKILSDEELTEDIFQDTFLKLFNTMSKTIVMTNLKAYIMRIARNNCLSVKRSKHYGLTSLEDLTLDAKDTNYEHKELLELVRSAIDCLPDDYREPFVLKEYNSMSYKNIAEFLNISESTVKIRIYRAKKSIHKILSPYLNEFAKNS